MILTPNDATISYRCPVCGEFITSIVGVFSLSGEFIRLKCPCSKSELHIKKLPDGKIRFSVPCLLCENSHDFTITQSALFSSEIFSFACPCSSFDICFVGKQEKVEAAVEESRKEFDRILEENDMADIFFSDDEEEDEDEISADFSCLSIELSVIKELLEEGNVFCGCPDEKTPLKHEHSSDLLSLSGEYENNCKGEYVVEIIDNEFVLSCVNCGKKYVLPSNPNSPAFDSFISIDKIYLV